MSKENEITTIEQLFVKKYEQLEEENYNLKQENDRTYDMYVEMEKKYENMSKVAQKILDTHQEFIGNLKKHFSPEMGKLMDGKEYFHFNQPFIDPTVEENKGYYDDYYSRIFELGKYSTKTKTIYEQEEELENE